MTRIDENQIVRNVTTSAPPPPAPPQREHETGGGMLRLAQMGHENPGSGMTPAPDKAVFVLPRGTFC